MPPGPQRTRKALGAVGAQASAGGCDGDTWGASPGFYLILSRLLGNRWLHLRWGLSLSWQLGAAAGAWSLLRPPAVALCLPLGAGLR